MSRRSAEGGVAQPRKKKPPASVLGEASFRFLPRCVNCRLWQL